MTTKQRVAFEDDTRTKDWLNNDNRIPKADREKIFQTICNYLDGLPDRPEKKDESKFKLVVNEQKDGGGLAKVSLPESIDLVPALEIVAHNLISVPNGLSKMRGISKIDFSGEYLTSFAKELLFLPRLHSVNLKGNPLSKDNLEEIKETLGEVGMRSHIATNSMKLIAVEANEDGSASVLNPKRAKISREEYEALVAATKNEPEVEALSSELKLPSEIIKILVEASTPFPQKDKLVRDFAELNVSLGEISESSDVDWLLKGASDSLVSALPQLRLISHQFSSPAFKLIEAVNNEELSLDEALEKASNDLDDMQSTTDQLSALEDNLVRRLNEQWQSIPTHESASSLSMDLSALEALRKKHPDVADEDDKVDDQLAQLFEEGLGSDSEELVNDVMRIARNLPRHDQLSFLTKAISSTVEACNKAHSKSSSQAMLWRALKVEQLKHEEPGSDEAKNIQEKIDIHDQERGEYIEGRINKFVSQAKEMDERTEYIRGHLELLTIHLNSLHKNKDSERYPHEAVAQLEDFMKQLKGYLLKALEGRKQQHDQLIAVLDHHHEDLTTELRGFNQRPANQLQTELGSISGPYVHEFELFQHNQELFARTVASMIESVGSYQQSIKERAEALPDRGHPLPSEIAENFDKYLRKNGKFLKVIINILSVDKYL